MQTLIKNTAAYKIFSADVQNGKLSHAYMLVFGDPKNLRAALTLFAAEFFGQQKEICARISSGSYPDVKLYPREGKKITVEGISEIVEDTSLKPVEGDKKLYIIDGFDGAPALVQNKLLKTLEEPLPGIYFLLGATSLAPVLGTVISRVRLLEIPPFGEGDILAALNRQSSNPLNAEAAAKCGGILGAAQDMAEGGWFLQIEGAAREICSVCNAEQIPAAVKKYGETKYKRELLCEMQNVYFSALNGGESVLQKHTLVYALELLNRAFADLKFNAYFAGLLYDFLLRVVKENDKWLKLQA